MNGPASPSPVTDGDHVYAFFQDFGLIAFTADGKEQWRLPLGPFNMFYGFGASPILVDGTILLPVDQDTGSYLLAVDAKTGKQRYKIDRPGVISGYSTPTVYESKDGGKQVLIPESFQLSAYDVKDGRRVWWVRGLACEMKSVISIEGDTAYVNGWGFSQNQPGMQVPTIPWDEGLKVYDKNHDGKVGDDEVTGGPAALDKMLSPKYGFSAFDGDRDGKLDAKEWDVMRAMLAAENGLLAIKLGGKGDVTSGAIMWKYTAPGAAGALDAPLQGRAVHDQRQRHPALDRSRDRQRAEAGAAEGSDRQVLRVAGRRRRQGIPGQPGRHRVGSRRQRGLGDPLRQSSRRRSVRHAGDRRQQDLRQDQVHALRLRRALTLRAPMGERAYVPATGRDAFLWLYDPFTRLAGAQKIFRALIDQAGMLPDQAALDIGCGTGTLAVLIKRLHPNVSVTGLDPDPKALARARSKAERTGVAVRFDRGFADALEYKDATFDRVFSSLMFHHLRRDDRPKALAEIHRVLKPGGSLEFMDIAGSGGHTFSGTCSTVGNRRRRRSRTGMLQRLRTAGFADSEEARRAPHTVRAPRSLPGAAIERRAMDALRFDSPARHLIVLHRLRDAPPTSIDGVWSVAKDERFAAFVPLLRLDRVDVLQAAEDHQAVGHRGRRHQHFADRVLRQQLVGRARLDHEDVAVFARADRSSRRRRPATR